MGGSSGGGGMPSRPEVQAPIYPAPKVNPIAQPNPGVTTQYGQYYLPPNLEALRNSLMSPGGAKMFGVQSGYRQVDPASSYAAPRLPQIFMPQAKSLYTAPEAPPKLNNETAYDSTGRLKEGWQLQKRYTSQGVVEEPIWVGIPVPDGGGGTQ